MQVWVKAIFDGGRRHAFPLVWGGVLAAGVGLQQPLPQFDAPLVAFNVIPPAAAEPRPVAANPDPMLTFVRHEIAPEDIAPPTPRVLAEREQLLFLRDKLKGEGGLSVVERLWLDKLADRYDTTADKLDELVKRVDIVP